MEYLTHRDNTIHAFRTGLNSHQRKVLKFTLNGEFVEIYDSITQAATKNNTTCDGIVHTCRGKQKTSGHFIWRYAEDVSYKFICLNI